MSNPDFLLWVHGIASLWPRSLIRINTNGTQMDRWPTLYSELLPYLGRVYVSITNHNDDTLETTKKRILQFLDHDVVEYTGKISDPWLFERAWRTGYENVRDPAWPKGDDIDSWHDLPRHIKDECQHVHGISPENYLVDAEAQFEHSGCATYIDKNQMRVGLSNVTKFRDSSVIYDRVHAGLRLHSSDPSEALDACQLKFCHTMSQGMLAKCPVATILPEFIQQFPVDVDAADRELIMSYRPCSPNDPDHEIDQYLTSFARGDVIPQCKFCPTDTTHKHFAAGNKKIKIEKITN